MVDIRPLLQAQDDDDDEGLGFGGDGPEAKQRLKHPIVAFFHIFFRAAAIIVYLLCGAFDAGFITSFVTVVILLSLDFWTVKNITGRILVGLRWWNYIDENDASHWVFETRKGVRAGGRAPERRVFWTALIVTPLIWILLFFSSFFTFRLQWTILVVLALVLQGANLYGYIRCKLGHTPGLTDAAGILQTGISNIILRRATAENAADSSNAFGTQQV